MILLTVFASSRLSTKLLTAILLLQMSMNAHSRLLVMQMLCAPTPLVPTHVPALTATLEME